MISNHGSIIGLNHVRNDMYDPNRPMIIYRLLNMVDILKRGKDIYFYLARALLS